MFSLRAVMLLALTIYLLPTDPAHQRRFMEHASSAAAWASTFCDRNAGTCEIASSVWTDMKHKATFAAGMVYDIATRSAPPSDTTANDTWRSTIPAAFWTTTTSVQHGAKGTLTRDDLKPVWRGHPAP